MQNEVQRGRNIDYLASQLTSANTIAGTPVQGGDAVVIGDLVGVASSSAVLPTDLIDVQHKGVFNLPVTPAAALTLGSKVYIAPATGILSDATTGVWYGHALQATNAGTAVIPVRLKH